ncbi:prostate and testis expressed protein 2 [Ornithorhynchus anatinus]|uniref:prostate and testis expressed protein 2 n=1 Tax=Ornithorhynchus anatinus TaxID=9258 RepID=UPI0010A7E41F|nr:prostate and testis expressed protein 2 [Ornithorhynchus anatinus]
MGKVLLSLLGLSGLIFLSVDTSLLCHSCQVLLRGHCLKGPSICMAEHNESCYATRILISHLGNYFVWSSMQGCLKNCHNQISFLGRQRVIRFCCDHEDFCNVIT